jgi:hypothetical protein
MSSPTVQMPDPIDAVAVANQQGQNNLEAAIATSLLNQTNEVTPYGTVSYTRNNGYANTPTQQQGPSSYQQGPSSYQQGSSFGLQQGQQKPYDPMGSINAMGGNITPNRSYAEILAARPPTLPSQYEYDNFARDNPGDTADGWDQFNQGQSGERIAAADLAFKKLHPTHWDAQGNKIPAQIPGMPNNQSNVPTYNNSNYNNQSNVPTYNNQSNNSPSNGGYQNPTSGFNIGGMEVPSFTRTVTLSPAQQAKLNDQDYIQGQTAGIAKNQLGRVEAALGQGIDYNNLPSMVSNISGGQIQGFNPNAGQVQNQLRQFDPLGGINNRNLQGASVQNTQGAINQAGLFGIDPQAVQNQLSGNLQGANVQNVQRQLEGDLQGVTVNQAQGINTGGLQDVRDDFGLQGNELERATFERGRSLLEPQFGRAMRDAEVRLSERGLPLGSEAGSEILGGVQTNQNRALNELALASVAAGRGEQARLFGQDMALRGQQFGERATGTQLGNQAIGQNFSQDTGLRGQQFGEQQARASLFNQAGQQQFGQETALRGQQFGEDQARASLFNQAGQQAFGQNTAARQQLVNERMNQAALANQANQQRFDQQTGLRGQQFGERQAEAAFANQARGQAFQQGAMGAEFQNQAQQQRFAQQQQANALNNQLQAQAYQQAAGNAQLQNTARQNALQEQIYNRNMPLNDLAALMGQSGGIQLPQFAQSPNVAVQSADLLGATLASNQQAIDVAKAKQQASSGFMGGLMELGGALGGAAIMSDIKSKTNIKRIGKYKGHNLYSYNYIDRVGDWIGVMAQEIEKVIPEAVQEINGMKHVNYGAI